MARDREAKERRKTEFETSKATQCMCHTWKLLTIHVFNSNELFFFCFFHLRFGWSAHSCPCLAPKKHTIQLVAATVLRSSLRFNRLQCKEKERRWRKSKLTTSTSTDATRKETILQEKKRDIFSICNNAVRNPQFSLSIEFNYRHFFFMTFYFNSKISTVDRSPADSLELMCVCVCKYAKPITLHMKIHFHAS